MLVSTSRSSVFLPYTNGWAPGGCAGRGCVVCAEPELLFHCSPRLGAGVGLTSACSWEPWFGPAGLSEVPDSETARLRAREREKGEGEQNRERERESRPRWCRYAYHSSARHRLDCGKKAVMDHGSVPTPTCIHPSARHVRMRVIHLRAQQQTRSSAHILWMCCSLLIAHRSSRSWPRSEERHVLRPAAFALPYHYRIATAKFSCFAAPSFRNSMPAPQDTRRPIIVPQSHSMLAPSASLSFT
jgi:hypothetical protein